MRVYKVREHSWRILKILCVNTAVLNFTMLSKLRISSKYSYFEKGCRKNAHATIPKSNMGYDQYTVPNDCSCRTYFCCFPLAIANITSQTSRAILPNFFEEQCTQNHP